MQLRIDPVLEATLPPHDQKTAEEFEQMILEHGQINDPIWTWRGIIVDGHHRFRLAKKHGLSYEVREVFGHCTSIEDVQYEMRRSQVAKRRLTDQQRRDVVAAMVAYGMAKKGLSKTEAVIEAAKAADVTPRTAFRDLKTKEHLEKVSPEVKSVAPHIAQMTPANLKTFAALDHADQESIVERNDRDIAAIETELRRSRVVPPKPPQLAVFGDADARQTIQTPADRERIAKRPLLDSITDAMQALGNLNKHVAECKSINKREYNDVRFNMKQIDEILERWLEEVQRTEGLI